MNDTDIVSHQHGMYDTESLYEVRSTKGNDTITLFRLSTIPPAFGDLDLDHMFLMVRWDRKTSRVFMRKFFDDERRAYTEFVSMVASNDLYTGQMPGIRYAPPPPSERKSGQRRPNYNN